MFHLRLHAKFLLIITGSLVLLLGALTYVIIEREASLLQKKSDEKQHVIASALLSDLRDSMRSNRPRNTPALMKSLRDHTEGLVSLAVLRRDGSVVCGATESSVELPPRLEQAFVGGSEVSFHEQGDVPLHTVLSPLQNEQKCRTCHSGGNRVLGVLLVALSREEALRELGKSRRDLIALFGLLAVLISAVLYAVIGRVILRPLADLHRGAEQLGRGCRGHRITLSTGDEMQDLAQAFNSMAGRLEESRDALEQKIDARTAELLQATSEVEEKAERLATYSHDLTSIARLSSTVFRAEISIDEIMDSFMDGITHGLGYDRASLCLADRQRARLTVVREAGGGGLLPFQEVSLAGSDPFAALVRSCRLVLIDESADAKALGFTVSNDAARRSLCVLPILSRSHGKPCSELTSCIKTDCPAYRQRDRLCWQVPGTLCGNPLAESCSDKLSFCVTCKAFPIMGVLVVSAERRARQFSDSGVEALRILVGKMATALENHQLHEQNQRMVRELLELHRVTAAALSDLSLEKALEVFTDSALKFSGLNACSFWLLSRDGAMLERKGEGFSSPEAQPDLFPDSVEVSGGLLGRVYHENRFVLEYDAGAKDATRLGLALAAQGLNALFAVPLRSENRPIGVFSVHKRNTSPFLEAEIAGFMLLANQVSMAINVCLLNEELKNQNQELARQTNLMSGILASMASGVVLLDADSTVRMINVTGAAILRASCNELMERRLQERYPPAAAFVRSAPGPYQEVEITMPDGITVPIGFSSASCQGAAGAHEGVIVVFRDLTEIKSLQTELLQKERFAVMGRLVAGVAHEIRNPLFGISAIGQIFERELESPAHLELATALVRETKRLNQLVEELLVYGRPMKLTLEKCDFSSLWEEVLEMHQSTLTEKGLAVSRDFSMRHPEVFVDVHQIRQVFFNLLRNAMDATPTGGTVSIRLQRVDGVLVFDVIDTGAGIPPENHERVFELFFTTKPRGTGLGLAICKKIVQDHGGEITLKSAVNAGTTVTVKLPCREGAEERSALAEE